MPNEVSQQSQRVDLAWDKGDPVSLSFIWADVDYSGTYVAKIRDAERDGEEVGELTVDTDYDVDVGTTFTLTMSQPNSDEIEVGQYWWSLTVSGGVTRLHGKVNVHDGRQA